MNEKLKVVSLFCGCGGSDLGLLGGFEYLGQTYPQLPFEIVYALDFDKFAVQTYNTNFEHPAVCDDVKNLDISLLDDFDVLLGGFPCQSFSTLNPSKDTNDARANLYKELVKVLQIKQPKYFIFENVKGLMTLQKGEILKKVLMEFEQAGYDVQYKLLLASHFGIPQKRERIFMVGIRKDLAQHYVFPNETHAEQPNLYQQPFVKLEKIIKELAIDNPKYYFSEKAVLGMKNAKNNMKRGLYQDLQGQCLTITAHLAKTSLNSRDPVLLVDAQKELYRRFTPREAAGIQSFPENFQFPVSDIQAYRQIGNAIPPVLMWHVANALVECTK
ncbi:MULTISPECIES: DNA cytosine methyltransferase [Kingella]|uniref:DNA cytosine methyltransferase n=1 Tax=Kingella TaxID=32257 RepID=UPI00050A1CC5|nr:MULTISPECIES: DNA (cytosine-5-)-methyltransferase [Kingella]MDK4624338.1 DNA (cytosine-5-)-methyltransferase [Kingella kingae]MDK4659929.1 DNA (cytosine-5-)-methyltransferase [Kingella kingae]MDK4667856.1 DNA (cytosine-5-)-methyltransferase [Kingella kingae]MDK4686218.1 DNA (cytosine-5-)-methyltransferase [Kingella kingae]MDK4687686.1 DNA (cytosine-5-)-methyltransferase [Kingella negevensis]